ncbi:hypothetical protein B0T09DRAFT_323912 [Sordaria sp. MPI-SDFR-AT-0083]|nr:hypothetical protein B0T09DRAFT_323912 [Sordaria sp. MPI-SDFR-AT-0083]
MEHLSINDQPPPPPFPQGPGQPGLLGGGRPPQPQQLPAQMFTTAAQLLDLTDTNLVLQQTKERIFVPPGTQSPAQTRGLYADVDRGLFVVRGENVLLMGEIDLDRDDDAPPGYDLADLELVQTLAKQKKAEEKAKEKRKVKKLSTIGFEGENVGEALL